MIPKGVFANTNIIKKIRAILFDMIPKDIGRARLYSHSPAEKLPNQSSRE